MDTERTFTLKELLDFVASGEYWICFADAVRFVSEFADSIGEEMSEEEYEDIRNKFFESIGHVEA